MTNMTSLKVEQIIDQIESEVVKEFPEITFTEVDLKLVRYGAIKMLRILSEIFSLVEESK